MPWAYTSYIIKPAGAPTLVPESDPRKPYSDRRRIPLTDPLSIYSGCYIRASVNLYPFNANGNRGIAAGLSNIQFWEDGEPLNGRVRAEDEFDSLDAEDDEDFLD